MPDVLAGRFSLVALTATGASGAVRTAHDLRAGDDPSTATVGRPQTTGHRSSNPERELPSDD